VRGDDLQAALVGAARLGPVRQALARGAEVEPVVGGVARAGRTGEIGGVLEAALGLLEVAGEEGEEAEIAHHLV